MVIGFNPGKVATLRLGFDLFKEVNFLLKEGQPLVNALVPTLDLHIRCLRKWMLEAGVTVAEIVPTPAGKSFAVCLTHDIDFIGIRQHRFDHTMFGFLARATVGSLLRFIRGKESAQNLCRSWAAASSLPLVHLGLVKDYWVPFEWYLEVEEGLAGTYYLIPFKNRPGDKVSSSHPQRRAAAYDLADLGDWIPKLKAAGCEVGVHGIDAWHDPAKGEDERRRLEDATKSPAIGIRMHWLLWAASTPETLERAGYDYDSTFGYNESPGYRAGTCQVFRHIGLTRLLQLPLHIQDGALFYPKRLDLSEKEASQLCRKFIDHARENGGVLTLLWHDRSHGPERFWGGFYQNLVEELKRLNVWFGNAKDVTDWFRARRAIVFKRDPVSSSQGRIIAKKVETGPSRSFSIRIQRGFNGQHRPVRTVDVSWNGEEDLDITTLIEKEIGQGKWMSELPLTATGRNQ